MTTAPSRLHPFAAGRVSIVRALLGLVGSATTIAVVWQFTLVPMQWPPLPSVLRYFVESASAADTYRALLATGVRATLASAAGFVIALAAAVITGRTVVGWVLLFFSLLLLQKVPAIAMIHVLVRSRLGIGLPMTLALATTVVFAFSWLVLHHRARTLDRREAFALRVSGLTGIRLVWAGLLPHFGASIGATLRLAIAIGLIMVVLGEWQGVWADGSFFSHGLGLLISRSYEATNSQARVLAYCGWLGILGILLDAIAVGVLFSVRRVAGINLGR